MSLNRCIHRFFGILTVTICAPVFAGALNQPQPTPHIVTAKFKLDEHSMILVPVSINGSGPYDFMLDTGCSKSIVGQKLADELRLTRVGSNSVAGVLASAQMSVVHADSLSVAGATVGGGEIYGTDRPVSVNNKVRGVLGEDFLRNFDVLIDYRHQAILLESGTGTLAETAGGDHLPLQLTVSDREKPTHNRLIVSGRIREFGETTMLLTLDSGANQLALFTDNLGPGEERAETVRAGSFNQWVAFSVATRRIQSLDLGANSVSDLTVVALSRRAGTDSDGLIPTSLFHSVFISHSGRFVILNPSFPKTSRDAPATLAAR